MPHAPTRRRERTRTPTRAMRVVALALCAAGPFDRLCAQQARDASDEPLATPAITTPATPAPRVARETIPGTTVALEFVPLTVPDGEGGTRALWFARTETTWDAFDVFVFRLDEQAGLPADAAVDAVARPSKPFVLADRGYGHDGYPAVSISHRAAAAFAAWMSARTGHAYRLPTEAEWDAACALDAPADLAHDDLDALAWTRENAVRKTHPVASKAAGRAGLHDLLGNVAEWCDVPGKKPALKGGTFVDRRSAVGCSARIEDDPSLNQTDPQIPKSPWWLADGHFAGFRIVCDDEPGLPRGDDAPSPAARDERRADDDG